MTLKDIGTLDGTKWGIREYIGLAADTKPTSVPVGSTVYEYDTLVKYITYDGSNWVEKADAASAIEFVIDGGGSAITTGVKGFIEVPFAAVIVAVSLLADQSGSIVVDIWKDTYANYPPADADSITASAPPTITAATKSQDITLTGWTTTIARGDIIGFNVDSITDCERVTVSLKLARA